MALRLALAACLIGVLAPAALAQTDTDRTDLIAMGGDYTFDTWPRDVTRRPLLLAPGMLELGSGLGISFSKGALFKPVTLPASVLFGASDHFSIFASNDPGLCLGGSTACPHHEQGLGVGILVGLVGGAGTRLQLGVLGDVHVDTFSPFAIGVRLAAPTRLLLSGAALELAAGITILFNGPARDRERLELPLELQLRLRGPLALLVDTGLSGPASELSTTLDVPVALGLQSSLSKAFDLGGRFGFPNLLGRGGTADVRSLQIFVKYRR